jgi:hypothetical protein
MAHQLRHGIAMGWEEEWRNMYLYRFRALRY